MEPPSAHTDTRLRQIRWGNPLGRRTAKRSARWQFDTFLTSAPASPQLRVNRARTCRRRTIRFFTEISLFGIGVLLWGGRGRGFESRRSDHYHLADFKFSSVTST